MIFLNSQENTCDGVLFLGSPYYKKRILEQLSKRRGILRTRSNIYDVAILRKYLTSKMPTKNEKLSKKQNKRNSFYVTIVKPLYSEHCL